MTNVPDRIGSPRDLAGTARTAWFRHRGEVEVARHQVVTWVQAQRDMLDTDAVTDAISYATEEELRFLTHFVSLVDGSELARELVFEKLALLSQTNSRRICRRFR